MRARRIGRADGLHDGEFFALKQLREWLQARMQTEKSVEINRGILLAAFWLRNGDRGAQAVVIRLGERYDDVQAVHRAALEEHHEFLFVWRGRFRDGAPQK